MLVEGANLQVVNGSQNWWDNNGLGNLVVGPNVGDSASYVNRNGSHNVIVGSNHAYNGNSNIVGGNANEVHGLLGLVTGEGNAYSAGTQKGASKGHSNILTADWSWLLVASNEVTGGTNDRGRKAQPHFKRAWGGPWGRSNECDGDDAVVVGGLENKATGTWL